MSPRHVTPKWITDAVLKDIVKHPINAGASEARDMAAEILHLRRFDQDHIAEGYLIDLVSVLVDPECPPYGKALAAAKRYLGGPA